MTDLTLGAILKELKDKEPKIDDLDLTIELAHVDPDEEIEQDPVLLSIGHEDLSCDIMTLGNFSVIIGKAKSRKSFLATLFTGIVARNKPSKDIQPMAKGNVVYIDTEQGRWHVWLLSKRLKKLSETKEHFRVFGLRGHSPAQILQLIDKIIVESPDLVMVIIDGVRDLVYNINDEREATNVSVQLMNWTQRHNIHICTIIHQNKGDVNARGHIGSEVQNKAETVIEVEKVKGSSVLSKVSFPYTRGMAPNDFYFVIDHGLPIIQEYIERDEQ